MSFPEILEAVKALPRAEKLQILRALVEEVGPVAEEAELVRYFPPGTVFELCSPILAPGAAAGLQVMLDAEKRPE